MTLAPGTKLGPYEVVAVIGAGGMGEVYRARDARLGRDVALKVLSEVFASDPERLRRFEQEARAVAALNHPNILGLYDIGTQNGSPYLVSELLEGESLREMLRSGPVPSRRAGDYAAQIASGLAAAHEKGIVHRDLKPENLFITNDGRAKILDFGLAKLTQSSASHAAGSEGVTLTSSPTLAGVVMGTAGYMSPEQVRGEPLDHRTDIFAFGAVLYEMLSGQRAFHRDTGAETMTAILKEDPPELSDTAKLVSPALDRIVRRCLEKRPEQRFQSAQDLAFALGTLSGTDASGAARVTPAPRTSPRWLWPSAILALVGVLVVAWLFTRNGPTAHRMQFALPVPGEVSQMVLSADGQMLAFVSPDDKSGAPTLFVQRIGSPNAVELPGTDGANYPFWSPDDSYVAFFAKGKLLKVAASGGPSQALAPVSVARGGAWGSKNVIIYTPEPQGGLWRVNADGSGAARLTTLGKDEQSHRWPVFLPDGNHFLVWMGNFVNNRDDRVSGIYESSLDHPTEKKLLVLAHSNVGVAQGQIIYLDEKRQLVASAFDISKGAVSGEPQIVTPSIAFQPSIIWGAFSAANNGNLIYSANAQTTLSALTWVDRTGKELGRVGEPGTLSNPILSPDGKRVAVDIADLQANNVDVWLESLQGGSNTRFTFDTSEDVMGVWSRDGKTVAYRTVGEYVRLMLKAASGLEREKTLYSGEIAADMLPNSWTLDDQQILCTMFFPVRVGDRVSGLVLVPAGGGKPVPFLETRGSEQTGQISPDGKWAAYASNESGEWEVYVTTFPGAAGKWQVSRGGGTEPRWRSDGKQLFYIGQSGILTAAPVATDGTFSSGTPVPLFQVRGRATVSSTDLYTYDVSRDGKQFLVNRYLKPDHPSPLTIVLNATAETKK
jgi:eukaryotic-like serine/threonine-protein kinase